MEQDLDVAVSRAAGQLEEFIEAARARYAPQAQRIAAVGFSQGAGLLSVLLQRRPELFSRVGLLAGFVVPQPQGRSLDGLPILICHGSNDEVVPLAKIEDGAELLRTKGGEVQVVVDEVGHKVGSAGMRAMREFFG
jgi:phospholipase/carboxylesterase